MNRDLEKRIRQMSEALGVPANFDVVFRKLRIGNRDAATFCIDGFTDGAVLQRIIQFFIGMKDDEIAADAKQFVEQSVPFNETIVTGDWEKALLLTFSGMTCLLVEGFDDAILIDCREYPARSVDEPVKDKVLRGSRDGFVETIVFNSALIRRRIRSPELRFELMQAGTSSQTDVAIGYMQGRVNKEYLEKIRRSIRDIQVDSLTMNAESLAECIYRGSWFNPLPKFKYSERPDTAAASLLEGNIILLVDNSPSAMIIPNTIFDVIEDTDDYYFPPITGTYLRWSRIVITLLALFVSPLYLLLVRYADAVPEALLFTLPKETQNVPMVVQFLILEFAIDGMKLASLNTPNTLSTPLSVITGLVIGEFAVSSGWFNAEAMLYMAFVALANYSQSSFELGYALKFMRVFLLLVTHWFGVWGFAAGVLAILACFALNKNVAGKSYLYPNEPMGVRKIVRQLFRVNIRTKEKN